MSDALAVDQQVGQVVGDEVAHRDRQQPGPDRPGPTVRATAGREGDEAQERAQEQRPGHQSGGAEQVAKATVWDSPSKMIEPVPRATRTIRGVDQVASSRPLANGRRRTTRSSCVPGRGPTPSRQPAEQPEPDREHLALRPPPVAPELGHHRQRERGVADEHDEQRRVAGDRTSSSQTKNARPDTAGQAQAVRQLARGPATEPDAPASARAMSNERGERVEEVPHGPEDRGHDRDPHPAVDPQEQRRPPRRPTSRRRCPGR